MYRGTNPWAEIIIFQNILPNQHYKTLTLNRIGAIYGSYLSHKALVPPSPICKKATKMKNNKCPDAKSGKNAQIQTTTP